MKYYWIASTIEIKTAVLPCREINRKNYVLFVIVSHIAHFYWFLSHFIDHFYNIFKSSKSRPWLLLVLVHPKSSGLELRTLVSPDERPQAVYDSWRRNVPHGHNISLFWIVLFVRLSLMNRNDFHTRRVCVVTYIHKVNDLRTMRCSFLSKHA